MEDLEFPFSVQKLSKEEEEISKSLRNEETLRIVPGRYAATSAFIDYGPELYSFKPRPDDIWIIGYPRSGTTLTQEILYLLGTDLNYEKAASTLMDERFPYLEDILMRSPQSIALYKKLCRNNQHPETLEEKACIPHHKKLEKTNGRRFIKSHLGFRFLHPQLLEIGCKVVFIARNIKDTLVSNFLYPTNMDKKMKEGIYQYWKLIRSDLGYMGNYTEVLKEAWKRRHSENLLIIFYEDLTKDKRAGIKKIADFLGKNLTEQELDTLLDHVDIKKFKENKSVNNDHLVDEGYFVKNEKSSFIRQGKTGGWREMIPENMNEEMNKWFLERVKEIPDFEIPECWKIAMDL